MGYRTTCGLLAAALALGGCAALERANRDTPPPPEFSVPHWLLEFDSQLTPVMIKRHMARSGCGGGGAGLTGRSLVGPRSRTSFGGLVVHEGTLANGADWFAMKDARYRTEPDALCGLSIAATADGSQGSHVAIFGIRRHHFAAAIEAVEQGKFFCECEQLSGP